MKNFSTLDKTASAVILFCTALIGLVVFLGTQAGVRVKANLPERGLIGPYQVVTLIFSESVDPQMAESLFDIQPKIDGTFRWADSQTMQFASLQPFELGTAYKLTLRSGLLSQNDHELKTDQSWEMHVREPEIAYLKSGDGQSGVWTMSLNNTNPPRQLTDPSLKVIDFDASRDGEFVIFIVQNQAGGIDLWRATRDGVSSILLDCGLDRCTSPSISPDGTRVAYSREIAGPSIDLPYGSPRIWMLDMSEAKDGPVYQDQQVLGYHPQWSPDGMQLASYDGLADQIRLLNVDSGQQFIFQSQTGGPMTWSPDGTKFLFTDVEQSEGGVRTRVRMADLTINKTFTLTGSEDDMDYGYNSLAWSPEDDESVLLGMRAGGDDPSQVFWLFNPGRLDGVIVAGQPEYAYTSPHWDVWGGAFVFQQFKLKGPYKPEIGLWKQGSAEPLVVGEGLMPRWLP
ncbi:MAG: PD40 domain-containing protein [Anaerolineales bacterium]|nr:PD40 domain-containing protein [Anaerolineales bacterium]